MFLHRALSGPALSGGTIIEERSVKAAAVFYLFLWGLGSVFILLKGCWMSLSGPGFFDPDLLTVLTAYIFLRYGKTGAGVFAAGQGFLVDIFSCGLHGIFTTVCLGALGAIYLGCRFFHLETPRGRAVTVFVAVIFKKILLLLLFLVFSMKISGPWHLAWTSLLSAFLSAVVAPPVFYLFDRWMSIFPKEAA